MLPNSQNMSHTDLVERAIRWLKNSQRCRLVMSESYSWYVGETPDVIGWYGHAVSILIECKTSRADFCRDRRKYFRRMPHRGLGVYRYYMTPKDLLSPDELPYKWGLLEIRGKIVRKVKEAKAFDFYRAAYMENPLLISAALYRKAI